jgi:hypothetical protein
LADRVRDYPEHSVLQIVHGIDRDTLRAAASTERTTIEKIRAVRVMDEDLPPREHLRRELSNFPRDWLGPFLQHLGHDPAGFERWISDDANLIGFWTSVPRVNVMVKLMLARDRNRCAATQDNDVRDIAFMGIALPYANILVAEKLWSSVARATRLSSEYETDVITRLKDLPELLRSHGCCE